MAFVLFVFLMTSSVLLTGAPLHHVWFMRPSVQLESRLVDPSFAWLPVSAALAFTLVFMLAGVWFLRHTKNQRFCRLRAVPTDQGLRVGGLLEVGPCGCDADRGPWVRVGLPLQALGQE